MSAQMTVARSTWFRVGWITLLAYGTLATVGYLSLMFVFPEEATVFLGWAAYTLYALAVVAIPFRRGERWAWYTSWILVVGFALPIFLTSESFAAYNLFGAGIVAVALLLTRPAFFRRPRAM